MKAYAVVGPTNVNPRRLRSFESATDSAELGIAASASRVIRRGRLAAAGSKRQK